MKPDYLLQCFVLVQPPPGRVYFTEHASFIDGRLLTILASLYKTQETLYIDATVKLLQMHTSELITMSDVSRGLRTLKLTRKMVNT